MRSPDKGLSKSRPTAKAAMSFILLMGIISLFSDMTHEGAHSILGDFLSLAGASAATIGFVSGFGEMVGYSLRLATGILADRTKKYWTITLVGYAIDVLAIPALALVPKGGWVLACALIIIERAGKAVKKPAKDTLLSFAATQTGIGKSFAVQEMLDQIGAFSGPVILFVVLLLKKDHDLFSAYSLCFAVLGIPAIVTMILLFTARHKFPNPESFEPDVPDSGEKLHVNGAFKVYIAAIGLFAFGFIDFALITMHTARAGLVESEILPLLYAGAMAVDAVSALIFGRLYDKIGFKALVISTLISSPFAVIVFTASSKWVLLAGVALWGAGMGAQESILKAAVTTIVPKKNRSAGFGVFQTAFGVCWFLGSWLMGALYDASPAAMVSVSVAAQLASVPLFLLSNKKLKEKELINN